MMVGAYIAYLIKKNAKIINLIKSFNVKQSCAFYLFIPLFFIIFFILNKNFEGTTNQIIDVMMRLLFILHQGFMFVDQVFNEKSIFNLAKQKFLIHTGKIAYGLYCFHGLVLTLGTMVFNKYNLTNYPIAFLLIMFGVTYAIAMISYKYFEKPFLNLKNKLRRI